MSRLLERFLRYVQVDTASDANSPTQPSTAKQLDLGKMLVADLQQIGLGDAYLDEYGYVYATLPGNVDYKVPTLGFIAHVDVVADVPTAQVKPRIVENYDGGIVSLNDGLGITLSPLEYPELVHLKGHDLVVTDGTTLLGADNKAGIAEIITAVEYLLAHPDIARGTVRLAFTPDEEIARGTAKFDVQAFGADYAYTLDGGALGGIEYETFNAASAKVTVKGRNIHPGASKNKMRNAILMGQEFNSMLPCAERPAHTEGYEGFYHLTEMNGVPEQAILKYIIRDHDKEKFVSRKARLQAIATYLNGVYGAGSFIVEVADSYYNMAEKILPVMHIVDAAKLAMREIGVEPITTPVRGGTDGARLSYMGLPCPNLFTGGHNYHSTHEYASVQTMEKAVELVVKLIENNALNAKPRQGQ
ncbi:MAG: peptidase T [Peptococcaceae bacterium]|nr:peptidase T [Peptococcaceae bacterium]